MTDINNLGTFGSIDDVWTKYPEGGREGDYLMIENTKYRWNKYIDKWENADTVTESNARKAVSLDDLDVQNNLRVAGILFAHAVKQPNCGLFKSLDTLKARYPNPEVGMWATIGETIPGEIYRCTSNGIWEDSGKKGGEDNIDLTEIQGDISKLQNAQTLIIPITISDNNAITASIHFTDITEAKSNGKAIFINDGTHLYHFVGNSDNKYKFATILDDGKVYSLAIDSNNAWTFDNSYSIPSISDYEKRVTKEDLNASLSKKLDTDKINILSEDEWDALDKKVEGNIYLIYSND